MELARFLIVSIAGIILDIVVAYLIIFALGTPVWVAAGFGFFAATCFNYLLHEVWSFKNNFFGLSKKRLKKYIVASGFVLLIRLASVKGLTISLGSEEILQILILGAGISFVFNYFVSKFLIFSPKI